MSEPKAVVFRDLLTATKDGDWGKGEPQQGYAPAHVIRGTDFTEVSLGRIAGVPLRYLAEKTVHRRLLRADDILIETAGGSRDRPTGRTALISQEILDAFPGDVTCASFARFLRVDPLVASPRYVYWYLQYLYARGDMWTHQVQHTGVARFQFTRFAETEEVPLPSRAEQDAIAAVLGALDDKIAVNERIAAAALELGGEKFRLLHRMANEEVTVGDLVELKYGKSLPAARRVTGDIPVFGSGGISGSHNESFVKGPGIIVGRKGTVGSVYWSEVDFFPIDTTFYVACKNSKASLEYMYFALRGLGLEQMNSDSAVPGLNRDRAQSLSLRIPTSDAMQEFTAEARNLFQLQRSREEENRTLVTLRATLLLQLMSGRLRVKDAEQIVEDHT
ncbi:restriction endonuclease subunit S [Streptomyces sp. NPDC057746]|uniref:restriction endonuclease subunit S n=1 Tax=Streptomyces sp. NPDC057746 TaxID=3346237 RepID=UPI00367A6321